MQVGVPKNAVFILLKLKRKNPIITYGTSHPLRKAPVQQDRELPGQTFFQGNWVPVINLGFSGNEQLEPELIHYISGIDVSLYVLG